MTHIVRRGLIEAMAQTKKPLPVIAHRVAIADRLVATREALELRPVDVCRRLGVEANTLSQWESGDRRPNLDDMIRYCAEFRVTLDWIYLGDPSGLPLALAQKLIPRISLPSHEDVELARGGGSKSD